MVEQRYLLLPIIDRQWVDHLYVMDHLKTGIGLRGYGQKDPRVEYEKEAFEIFESLKNNIADEAIKGVFRVVIEHGPPPQQLDAQGGPGSTAVRADSVGRTRFRSRRDGNAGTRYPASRSSSFSARCPVPTAARNNCTRIKTTNRRQNQCNASSRKSAATKCARAAAEKNIKSATAPRPSGIDSVSGVKGKLVRCWGNDHVHHTDMWDRTAFPI